MTETDQPAELDPTEAFEGMNRRLAGMSAAIDGFAMRFDQLQERDYGEDLARIDKRIERFVNAINTLNQRPAMALTPADIAEQIEAGAQSVREADHTAWAQARQELSVEVSSIRGAVYSARESEKQDRWLLYCGGLGLVFGAALMFLAPRAALSIAPDSWLWREKTAVAAMGRDGWTAAERLMQASDPKRWEGVAQFLRLPEQERAKFAACMRQAYNKAIEASCFIGTGRKKGA